MSSTATAPSALTVARAFADAYGRGDLDGLTALLHPQVREREITPGAIVDQRGPEGIRQEVADFLAPYGPPEIVRNELEPVGPLFRWSTRWRLGGRIVEWHAFLEVTDGRISRLDGVCSGLVDEPEARPA